MCGMKWIKLSDELPPFSKLIVLLSKCGLTKLDVRETQNQIDEFNARMYSMSKELGVTDMVVQTRDCVGLPTPKVIGDKWEYWCLLPDKPSTRVCPMFKPKETRQ